MNYRIGIDVGGTNTDAVILDENNNVVAKAKSPTTEDVTSGIYNSLNKVLIQKNIDTKDINYVMLGTTHCTNAIVERKGLRRVAVVRIGKPATMAIKPMVGWPQDLIDAIGRKYYIISGGYEFNGEELYGLDYDEIDKIAEEIDGDFDAIAITSVFSPVNTEHEDKVAEIFKERLGDRVDISVSHEIGSIGLIERENATILNAALAGVIKKLASGFQEALKKKGIEAVLYLAQNDGTLMSVEYAMRYPIMTIASGPTNSLRGAAYLSRAKNAVVVDVGGTTSDIGVLVNGFPRQSAMAVEIGGVRTNFRMPDLISIGLGGGSIVREKDDIVTVGPDSVGYKLEEKGLVFGGSTLTASDVAVAGGLAVMGNPEKVKGLDKGLVEKALYKIKEMVEDNIDKIKTTAGDIPLILVGGGSVLLPETLKGCSEVIRPQHYEVANAIGVAIAQVGAEIDRIFSLDGMSRAEALRQAEEMAIEECVKAGAQRDTIEIVEREDIPLAYLPGNATRIKIKAAGNLAG
ncbi:MAG: hydantoinase/oxoprolinase family protein [Thermoanaerobacteraceae bacterium]|nr:hydantoinase/oxoprolinase family protein [Thermoanaerobacteraceae bacterium]